ncbi:Uncharacterised protein [Vibrio cholerae]|nr:Uncharacterised protein [Vibrio cholerae]
MSLRFYDCDDSTSQKRYCSNILDFLCDEQR